MADTIRLFSLTFCVWCALVVVGFIQAVAVWEELYLCIGKTEMFFIKCHQGVDIHPPKVVYRFPFAFVTSVRLIIALCFAFC